MMDLAQFNDLDAYNVKAVEDQASEALKIRDPIDRYLALEKAKTTNVLQILFRNKDKEIKRICDRVKGEIENKYDTPLIVVAGMALCTFMGAWVGGLAAGIIGVFAGIYAGLSMDVQKDKFIGKKIHQVKVKARDLLEETRRKIKEPLNKIEKEQTHILGAEPQVAEYLQMKKDSKLSDLDIRAMAAKKFPPKTVTPDDLSVTLPESGAVKHSIKLKKG